MLCAPRRGRPWSSVHRHCEICCARAPERSSADAAGWQDRAGTRHRGESPRPARSREASCPRSFFRHAAALLVLRPPRGPGARCGRCGRPSSPSRTAPPSRWPRHPTIKLTTIAERAQQAGLHHQRTRRHGPDVHRGAGRLFVRKSTVPFATPLLDISGSVSKGGEHGNLLVPPVVQDELKLHVTIRGATRSFADVDLELGDRVESGSGRTVLWIRPAYVPNGGMLAFGPDDYIRRGGSAGDPGNRAQSIDSLLQDPAHQRQWLDVHPRLPEPVVEPVRRVPRNEIWQRGLCNPWRFSFDRKTGSMWIGDVGEYRYEEVNRLSRGHRGRPGRQLGAGA